MMFHIIPLYAALLGLLFIVLFFRVVVLRRSEKIGLGSGGSKKLLSAIRVHANFAENVPFILILLLILEMQGEGAIRLHILGNFLLISRLLHIYGISKSHGTSFGRFVGSGISLFIIAFSSIRIILNTI
jgi:uncharacterized membrane protein YecN with MAPEG domain